MINNKIKLKTEFNFDAAHRLVGHKGLCSNLHGHMWRVKLEIEGDKNQLDKIGILWDYGNRKHIKKMFDHKTILWNCEENHVLIQSLRLEENQIYTMNKNPTAENLCYEILHMLNILNNKLKYKVTIWESPNSSCEVNSE